MKKKIMFMTTLGACLCLGALTYLTSFNEPIHTHAEGDGKETIYFDITTQDDLNYYVCLFNTDLENIPTEVSSPSFSFYYNNELKYTTADRAGNGQLYFLYNGNTPSAQVGDVEKYYSHYLIKAGTVMFTSDTANYVLKNDYNFWSTIGQNAGFAYLFQHGGTNDFRGTAAGDINSLKFTEFGGGLQDGPKRFLFQPKYEETSTSFTYGSMGWEQRCPIYIDKGEGYVLSAQKSKSPIIWEDGAISNSGESLLFSLYFSEAFDSKASSFAEVTMNRSYYSFYIPHGTLWGGIDHPFMIEGDYYFEITKDPFSSGYLHGFLAAEHNDASNWL